MKPKKANPLLFVVAASLIASSTFADTTEGELHVKDDAVTPEPAIINLDEKTFGGAETRNTYLRAAEQDLAGTADDRTITYFGGYYDQHRFVWEVDGEGSFPGVELMRLDYDSKLKLQSPTTGGNYITFDPHASTISFTHTGGSFSLGNASGELRVDGDTVVTQDSSGVLNLATTSVGTISGDIVIGSGDSTDPGLTVDRILKIKHPSNSAYDGLLSVEENTYADKPQCLGPAELGRLN